MALTISCRIYTTPVDSTQSLVIDDEELLPDEFVESFTEVVNKVKKDELKKAILAGTEIKGAHLETGPRSLQVR
ncbi:siphovirus Gp157 family protein [Serratia marcescens]